MYYYLRNICSFQFSYYHQTPMNSALHQFLPLLYPVVNCLHWCEIYEGTTRPCYVLAPLLMSYRWLCYLRSPAVTRARLCPMPGASVECWWVSSNNYTHNVIKQ